MLSIEASHRAIRILVFSKRKVYEVKNLSNAEYMYSVPGHSLNPAEAAADSTPRNRSFFLSGTTTLQEPTCEYLLSL